MQCLKCKADISEDSHFCSKCGTHVKDATGLSVFQTKTIQKPAISSDEIIAGKYKIIEEIGRGGMGVVYKADDTKLDRTVALKFLSPQLIADSEIQDRFIQEAKAASGMDHPNICTIHEINESKDGQLFIVMPYYEGESLKGKIDSGPLEQKEALDIAVQISKGLSRTHRNEIIHRDIKPANIMVTKDNIVKILDFGVAKLSSQIKLTRPGVLVGTVAYMSPEQTEGQGVDHRTDLWSLGVILYEMLTGQLPFKGEHEQAVCRSIQKMKPEPMTKLRQDVGMELEEIVKKAMAKNPAKRYQQADEMLKDLLAYKKELEAAEVKESTPLIKDLLRRRVLQIMAFYFVITFIIIKFVEWLINRFILSPHLPNFSLTAMLAMIPTVALLAYSHRKGSRHKIRKALKVGIPLNLILAGLLLFFIFHGKDLGAATQVIQWTDGNGATNESVIPKPEFRKKLGIFFFENMTGDPSLDWLQCAIPLLIEYDLSQDLFLSPLAGFSFFPEMKDAGYDDGIGLPLNLKSKIAEGFHKDFFVSGSFIKQNRELIINISVYRTKDAKLIAEDKFLEEDIFNLIDDMTLALKRELKIPERHINETIDLPVSEIGTDSIAALELFIKGLSAKSNNEWNASIKYLEQSVKEDETFAFAHHELQGLYSFANRDEEREQAFQALMQYRDKLPERQQFIVNSEYFFFKKDPEKQLAVVETWVEFFPYDIVAHSTLAGLYRYRNQLDDALGEYNQILVLDPENYENLLVIGSIFEQKDEHEEAIKYYKQYATQFPKQTQSYTTIGGLYSSLGEFEQAKLYYDKALLLEPVNISFLLSAADVKIKLGNFDQAIEQYLGALEISKSYDAKMQVYDSLISFYKLKAQFSKALDYMHLKWELAENNLPKASALVSKLPDLVIYVRAGKADLALKAAESIKAELAPPWDDFLPIAYLFIYLELEDAENAEATVGDYEKFIEATGFEDMQFVIPYSQGRIHILRGEFEQAIPCFQNSLEIGPNDQKPKTYNEIGKTYRKLKKFELAVDFFEKAIKSDPFNPKFHYELALLYLDIINEEKAREHLNIALDVWKDADPGIAEVEDARGRIKAVH